MQGHLSEPAATTSEETRPYRQVHMGVAKKQWWTLMCNRKALSSPAHLMPAPLSERCAFRRPPPAAGLACAVAGPPHEKPPGREPSVAAAYAARSASGADGWGGGRPSASKPALLLRTAVCTAASPRRAASSAIDWRLFESNSAKLSCSASSTIVR